MLWKRKGTILAIWVVVAAGTAAVVYKLPPVYTSEAVILVDSQKIPDRFVASTVSTDLQDRLATISQQILSSTRLKKVIEDFDLYKTEKKSHVQEEILEMMRKDITVKLEKGWTGNKPGAFRVGYQGPDAAVVAQVANRLANLYIEENLKTREVQAEGTSEFIDTQLQEAKKRLDELEAAVSKYKLEHNGELPQQEQAIVSNLARLSTQLQANRDAISRNENSKATLEATLTVAESSTAALTRALESVPSSVERTTPTSNSGLSMSAPPPDNSSLRGLEAQYDQMRARYSETHPDMRRLRATIERAKLAQVTPAVPSTVTATATAAPPAAAQAPKRTVSGKETFELGQAREHITALKTQISMADKAIAAAKADERNILAQMNTLGAHLDRLPVREQEMAQITRDYEISKANYKSLLDKKLSAEMSTDMERRQKSERFSLLDPARVPEKPFKPNRPLFDAIGAIAGLAIGLAVGLGAEFRKGTILGEWELPADVPILGRLPYIDMRKADPPARPGRFGAFGRKLKSALVSASTIAAIAAACWTTGIQS